MRGITVTMALTILMTGPSWAGKEVTARKAVTAQCDRHAITPKYAPSLDHQRTSSARSSGGRLTPMDHLILEIYDNQFKGQGQQRGAMVGASPDSHWLPISSWPAAQRDPRVTRRYHRVPPSAVGNQVRIRTTFNPDGTRQVEIRDGFGRPIHWDLEANPQAAYGLLAGD